MNRPPGRTPNLDVTSRPSTATLSRAASTPLGGTTSTSASLPEIRSARLESTSMAGSLAADAEPALAATMPNVRTPTTHARLTKPVLRVIPCSLALATSSPRRRLRYGTVHLYLRDGRGRARGQHGLPARFDQTVSWESPVCVKRVAGAFVQVGVVLAAFALYASPAAGA